MLGVDVWKQKFWICVYAYTIRLDGGNTMILEEKIFKGCDPDASRYAWDNSYKKIYGYDNSFLSQIFDFDKLRITGQPSKYRYFAINRKESLNFPQFNKWLNKVKIGGDTDFNFKSGCKRNRKYEFYKDIIENEVSFLKLEKVKFLDQLNECKERHHSLENFSLMLVTGGLNNFKGSLSQDRIDRFVFLLNEYFELREDTRNYEHVVFSRAIARKSKTNENNPLILKDILYDYLNMFTDINDYCNKIYKISDQKLISDLIASGSKGTFKTGQDVVEYMRLAMHYWEIKARILSK